MLKLRKVNLGGKICLAILLAVICLGLPINKIEAAAPLTYDDMKLAGLDLGSTVDEIVERYGNPDGVREFATSGFGGNAVVVVNSFQGGLLEISFLKNNSRLIEIKSRASNVSTPRNIAAGNLDKDMFNAYGNRSAGKNNSDGNLTYTYSPKGATELVFEVNPNTHRILSISINAWGL